MPSQLDGTVFFAFEGGLNVHRKQQPRLTKDTTIFCGGFGTFVGIGPS